MIKEFKNEYSWLSNFTPCSIEFAGFIYPSVEHAYVASKTLDQFERGMIQLMKEPEKVKRFGRTLELRKDWEKIKIDMMIQFTAYKYSHYNPVLRKLLLDTGEEHIQEGNNWNDKFWGVCLKTGIGKNRLGKIIMYRRENLF